MPHVVIGNAAIVAIVVAVVTATVVVTILAVVMLPHVLHLQ